MKNKIQRIIHEIGQHEPKHKLFLWFCVCIAQQGQYMYDYCMALEQAHHEDEPMADSISTIHGLGEVGLVVFIYIGQFGLFLSYYNTQKGIGYEKFVCSRLRAVPIAAITVFRV